MWNIRNPGPKKVLNMKFELKAIIRTGDIKHGVRRTAHGARRMAHGAWRTAYGAKYH